MSIGDTPEVAVHPGMLFGRPHLAGHRLSTDVIAGCVFDGPGPEEAESMWEIVRFDVLVACWFEARHGSRRKLKAHWRTWLERYEETLWKSTAADWDSVPFPPRRDVVTA